MKKLFSLLLSAVLLCTLALSLSSCGYKKTFHVRMTVKDYGVIDIELDGKAAPITVKNFVQLVEQGFYDGLTFHRVIDGFMIQGGDPLGNGTGGSTPIKGEFLLNGYNNPIAHKRGVISMARRGNDYNSGSCQFFIVHETSVNNTRALDDQYAAFGHVTAGMEVVDAIVENAISIGSNGEVANPAVIESIVLLEDGPNPLPIVLWISFGVLAIGAVLTFCIVFHAKKKKKAEAPSVWTVRK
jgi:peptidyl-prolyl cis-trans isomerase B (cyclophilin B)